MPLPPLSTRPRDEPLKSSGTPLPSIVRTPPVFHESGLFSTIVPRPLCTLTVSAAGLAAASMMA